MSTEKGNCPYCNTINSYSDAKCTKCGEELPWANWVQARQRPSDALGAEPGSFAKGAKVFSDEGGFLGGALSGGAIKIMMVIIDWQFSTWRFNASQQAFVRWRPTWPTAHHQPATPSNNSSKSTPIPQPGNPKKINNKGESRSGPFQNPSLTSCFCTRKGRT
jgi:hypothetical protein